MSNTRNTLERIQSKLDESMGVRANDTRPQLSPVPNAKDVGRRALRNFGTLAIDSVIPDPEQPRTEFDEDEIARLAKSITEKGQLHPIHVRWSEEHAKWIIISGERRFRATRVAGLPTINCQFQERELSKTQILEQQLIENLLREDLKPIEEAKAFNELIKLNGWTGKELGEAIRVNPSKITRSLSLLKLPADIQEQVESGTVSARAAYELSKLGSEEQIRAALAKGNDESGKVSIARAQSQVRQRKGKAAPKTRGVKQTFTTEEGWKVVVSAGKKANYHEMEQALQEALDEVDSYLAQGCDGLFLPLVDNFGIRLPIKEIVSSIRSVAPLRFVVVDGAQALGHISPSLEDNYCDLFIAGCHKWLRGYYPMGIAFYGRPETKGYISASLARWKKNGWLDDPLLTFTEQLQTGRWKRFGETVQLTPLFTANAACLDSVAIPKDRRDLLTPANRLLLRHETFSTPWKMSEPNAEITTNIAILKQSSRKRDCIPAKELSKRWLEHGISVTALSRGMVRVSLPESRLTDPQLEHIKSTLLSI